jgi:hypothetical protein
MKQDQQIRTYYTFVSDDKKLILLRPLQTGLIKPVLEEIITVTRKA